MSNNNQGRRPQQYGNNEKSASFAIMVLALATLLAIFIQKCDAQPIGYQWCVMDSAGFRCENTDQLQVALDSIIPVCNVPATVIKQCLNESRYYLAETEVFTVYIEAKEIVGYKKNGEPRLKKMKR